MGNTINEVAIFRYKIISLLLLHHRIPKICITIVYGPIRKNVTYFEIFLASWTTFLLTSGKQIHRTVLPKSPVTLIPVHYLITENKTNSNFEFLV